MSAKRLNVTKIYDSVAIGTGLATIKIVQTSPARMKEDLRKTC